MYCKDLKPGESLLCDRKCTKKRRCARHKCNQKCCVDKEHNCNIICGKKLSCTKHKCDEICHAGFCLPCWRAGKFIHIIHFICKIQCYMVFLCYVDQVEIPFSFTIFSIFFLTIFQVLMRFHAIVDQLFCIHPHHVVLNHLNVSSCVLDLMLVVMLVSSSQILIISYNS